MTGITDFITARLVEDEQAARDASSTPAELDSESPPAGGGAWSTWSLGVTDDDQMCIWEESHTSEQSTHIARHDPARVRRQVEALRAVIVPHRVEPFDPDVDGGCVGEPWIGSCTECSRCQVLRAVASIWSDHPDYRPEWTA